MEVGCGQCLGCHLDYSRMWAMRITHEAAMYEYNGGNSFVTLTYRDPTDCDMKQLEKKQHVPDDWSLDMTHMQKFFKRLRKKFDDREIRYFYAGEYGRRCKHGIDVERVGCPLCNVGRPHFHVCLFGISFDDLEPYESDGGVTRYTSATLDKLWGYGFVDVGELTFASASYTARYVVKKVKGPRGPDYYCTYDMNGEVTYITPEYCKMSTRPGIGRSWIEKYFDDVYPADEVPVPGAGVMKGVPRYYDEYLRVRDPQMYIEVKEKRKKFIRENKEEFESDRLMAKHKVAKAKLDLFKTRDRN